MRIVLCLLFTFYGLSCAHTPLQVPKGNGIFPYANYQHRVTVVTLHPRRTMEMQGVVSYTAAQLKVIGLSTFGTTLFKIEEDLKTGKIQKEFFLEAIQRHEERFMKFYGLIRELITAPKGTSEFSKEGAQFVLSQPDDKGVYRKIHITDANFTVDIEVTAYDLL